MKAPKEFEINGDVTHPQPRKEIFILGGLPHSARNIGDIIPLALRE